MNTCIFEQFQGLLFSDLSGPLNLKKNKYLFQKWCIKVVNNNQRGSPNLAVNLVLNEILVHKVGVDIDTLNKKTLATKANMNYGELPSP